MRERIVIIGAGMAAARLVRELAAQEHDFAVTLVGAEPHRPYDRIRLSSVLAGEADQDGLDLCEPGHLSRLDVLLGTPAASIDRDARQVLLADGRSVPYDHLVLATGSSAVRLPLPGGDLPGVLTFRDLADVTSLLRASGRAVVIGGGLLGLEAAYGLAKRGLHVSVIHLMPWLMERQLDREAGDLLRAEIEARGIEVITEAQTAAIEGEGRVQALRLKDGRVLPTDLVVMAVGIRPETTLARAAGLAVNRGIVTDDAMRTSDSSISAIGECAEHRGSVYGLVAPAYEQAAILARRIAGDAEASYPGSAVFTALKVSGVNVYSAGAFADDAPGEPLTLRDPASGVYRKLLIQDGRLAGAVLVGETIDGPWYADLIRSGAQVEPIREHLLFGRALVEALHGEPAELAAAA